MSNHVERAIKNVAGVADLTIDLEEAEAIVESHFELHLANLPRVINVDEAEYKIQPKSKVE